VRISNDDVVEALAPANFFSARPYLFGSGIPTNEHLKTMEALKVALIVSLTLEPLKPGRAINHQPKPCSKPEFTYVAEDIFDGVEARRLHIPVTDGFPPTEEAMVLFLREAKEVIDKGGGVFVHCWLGKGRTGTLLAGYLIFWEKMDPKEAIDYIRSLSPGAISSQSQVEYLTNPEFPKNTKEATQPAPVIRTPACGECYQTRNQTTDRSLHTMLLRTAALSGSSKDNNCGVFIIGS